MSHHFDSPTAIEDGRLNLLDVYVFPEAPGTSTLILTVNPDSGRSSPVTFRADALYEFVIASDGGTGEDRAFRMSFGEPDADGDQEMRVRYAAGGQSRSGVEGTELGVGRTREAFALGHGGSAWFGLAGDPFWGDAPALFAFTQGLADNQYRPELFTANPANLLAGRNVTAIALQVPDVMFGGTDVAVWARISLYGHGPQRQVSRAAHPLLRGLFFPQPGADTEALNAGSPAGDVAAFGEAVRRTAAQVAELIPRLRPSPRCGWRSITGAGRASRSTSGRASSSRSMSPKYGSSSSGHPNCRSPRRSSPTRTNSSSGSIPTRESI
jgi:hypothetical protein